MCVSFLEGGSLMIKQSVACALILSSLIFTGGSDVREDAYSYAVTVPVCDAVTDIQIDAECDAETETLAPVHHNVMPHAPERDEALSVMSVFDSDTGECAEPHKIRIEKDALTDAGETESESTVESEKTETPKTEAPETETPKKEETKKDTSENKKTETNQKTETETEPETETEIPSPLTDEQFDLLFTEAKKYLGYEYVWGGSTPETSFDCSGYVSWVINNSGIGLNIGRINSKSIYKLCTKISSSELKPGDLVFFKGTYATSGVSHVGIYIGGGKMIHCGNGVAYADLSDSYWKSHFYAYGRLPNK